MLITLLTPDFKPTYVATKILLFPYVVVGIALLANQVSPKAYFPDLLNAETFTRSPSSSKRPLIVLTFGKGG